MGNVQVLPFIINCSNDLTSIDPNPVTGSHPVVAANPWEQQTGLGLQHVQLLFPDVTSLVNSEW